MTVTCPTPSFALAQFQQCLLKRVTVILTFCSVVYFSLFTTPLHILLSLLLLNLFFCSTCFSSLLLISPMPLIMWSCSLLCSCHFFFFVPTLLHHPPALFPPCPFFPSFFPPNPFFPCSSYHSGIQWMDYCCISCSFFTSACVYISCFPSTFLTFLYCFFACSTYFSALHFLLHFFLLPHSLCLSHTFLLLP